jgi:hypothetical protein
MGSNQYIGIRVTSEDAQTIFLTEGTATVSYDNNRNEVTEIIVKRNYSGGTHEQASIMNMGTVYRIVCTDLNDAVVFPVFKARLKSSQTSNSTILKFREINYQSFPYTPRKAFEVSMTKQEVFNQLKAGISGDEASGYSMSTLKELLSDLQPVNYKWLTYSADGQCWSAEIKGNSWRTNLCTIESSIVFSEIVEKLSQAIQAAEEAYLLINPYTPEAVEGLILRVSDAISAASKIPYMLKDLSSMYGAGSSTKDFSSGDITINLSNKDAGKLYIVAFQKPTNLNQIYKTLFPTAWKIVPLGNDGSDSIVYPVSLEIMVEESVAVYNAMRRATKKPTQVGQMWKFSIDGDFQTLDPIPDQTVDGEMGCINKSPQLIDIALAKDKTPLVVKRQVAQDDQAIFQLTPKIYFAYVSDLQEGDLITSDISASTLYELDLTNLKSIDLELSADPTTGKKKWTASNRKAAS